MEDKRLDFDAPLLSVRRFSSPARPPAGVKRPEAERRVSLPFYKADLKSGPVARPGIVPFVWEQTPGRPKDGPLPVSVRTRPKPPPGRILHENLENGTESSRTVASVSSAVSGGDVVGMEEVKVEKKKEEEEKREEKRVVLAKPGGDEEEDDAFLDALDTLSRTESFFMNCSVSGLTGGADAGLPRSGLFSTDPQVRDFMMGRFLPAAQAMASSSPQCSSRKPAAQVRETARMAGRAENGKNGESRRPLPLTYQGRANYGLQYAHEQLGGGLAVEDDDDDGDGDAEEDYGGDLSKACGLLPKFCMKSSCFLMNPVPGMKVRRRLPPPRSHRVNGQQNRNLDNAASLGQAGDEFSWEAVYKHKLVHVNRFQLENESKLTSESNQLTNWSDSPDGSSPYRRSGVDGISPYRNEAPSSPFHEGKGFLGVPTRERKSSKGNSVESFEKDGDHYWEMTPRDSSTKGSGSMSPAIEKTLYVDSVYVPETSHSKSSSVGTMADMRSVVPSDDKGSEAGTGSRRLDEIMPLESFRPDELQDKKAGAVEMEFPICTENLDHLDFSCNKEIKGSENVDVPLALEAAVHAKNNGDPLQSLLPPPLPKSPSESWLLRTLPSVSSKIPPPQSLLGIQVQPRKQPLRGSSTDVRPETKVKSIKQYRQIRFAEVLTKPVSPQ
ncbi:hypothetical protein IHE45_20G080800 [Dioscorea alata]|uniref:Uncharacterized protein n=2 Tax=Dioscorea alata TaxID=55571 RepID=A0ACB7TUZ1_DIOAL|nr:hypothetical protein IHE45_20G080800 [Dioscorea alata]KAH7651794.1 hypothetical protein IHE45_20G080800 [Dioscorea alata]